jgi:replicative DNA helicase
MNYDINNMFIKFVLRFIYKKIKKINKSNELLSAELVNSELTFGKYVKNADVAPKILKYLQEMLLYINYILIILNIHILFKKIRKKMCETDKEIVSSFSP